MQVPGAPERLAGLAGGGFPHVVYESDGDGVLALELAEEGQQLAEEFECLFLETSAKDNVNIEQVFTDVSLLLELLC